MNRQTVGPSAVSSWPHEVQDLAVSLYERGLLLHYLPYSGSWLWEAITAETDLLVTLLAVRAPHHADASRGRRTRPGSECTIFCETRASPLSASLGADRVCALGCTTSGRLATAGVEPTPPGGPPRDTAGCLRRRLCSPRLAMALWPYPLVVVECT